MALAVRLWSKAVILPFTNNLQNTYISPNENCKTQIILNKPQSLPNFEVKQSITEALLQVTHHMWEHIVDTQADHLIIGSVKASKAENTYFSTCCTTVQLKDRPSVQSILKRFQKFQVAFSRSVNFRSKFSCSHLPLKQTELLF